MVRSAICVVRCRNKNGKYMTRNLYLFQQVQYLCWFGNLNRLHLKPTGKKTQSVSPSLLEIILPLSDSISLRIPMTLHGGYGYFLDPHIWHECEITVHSILTLQVLNNNDQVMILTFYCKVVLASCRIQAQEHCNICSVHKLTHRSNDTQGSPYQAVTGKIYRLWEHLLPPANAQKS